MIQVRYLLRLNPYLCMSRFRHCIAIEHQKQCASGTVHIPIYNISSTTYERLALGATSDNWSEKRGERGQVWFSGSWLEKIYRVYPRIKIDAVQHIPRIDGGRFGSGTWSDNRTAYSLQSPWRWHRTLAHSAGRQLVPGAGPSPSSQRTGNVEEVL